MVSGDITNAIPTYLDCMHLYRCEFRQDLRNIFQLWPIKFDILSSRSPDLNAWRSLQAFLTGMKPIFRMELQLSALANAAEYKAHSVILKSKNRSVNFPSR